MDTNTIKKHLQSPKTIAVVGFSNTKSKDAHSIPKYLTKFYNVIPVNPNHSTVAGLKSYKSVKDVIQEGIHVNIVNVFRPGKDCLDIVKEIVAETTRPNLIWLQLGITNEEAKILAENNSIDFIQDKCIYVVHKNLYLYK